MDFYELFAGFGIDTTTTLFASLLCILIYQLSRRDRRNLPPSPGIRLPIIGHLHHMRVDMRQPCRRLRRKLGDVYSLQLGARLVIIISGYKALKEAFVKNADIFVDRPHLSTMDAVTQGRGFAEQNGPQWKEHRRFVLSTLKDLGMGRRILEGPIQKEAAKLVQLFKDTNEKPFYPRPVINPSVANIISSMLVGETFEHGEPLISECLELIETNIKYAIVACILDILPFLSWLPGDLFKFKTYLHTGHEIALICEKIIMKRQQDTDKHAMNDLTKAYLRAMKEKTKSGEDTSFSMDNLVGTIGDLIATGSETVTTTLTWCIVCMVEFPDIQQTLYEHVLNHIGEDGVASLADKPILTYLEAFYMEVLRFCDLAPILPSHAATQDTQLMGYTIPKEAIIIADLDSVLSDPDVWGDPDNFRPERFLGEGGRLIKTEENVSFFLGKRSCVGESLARMELFLILSCLIQNFEFRCPANETVTCAAVDGSFGMVHAPNPFNILAKQRQKKI